MQKKPLWAPGVGEAVEAVQSSFQEIMENIANEKFQLFVTACKGDNEILIPMLRAFAKEIFQGQNGYELLDNLDDDRLKFIVKNSGRSRETIEKFIQNYQ